LQFKNFLKIKSSVLNLIELVLVVHLKFSTAATKKVSTSLSGSSCVF
jgi:hypothetical protein